MEALFVADLERMRGAAAGVDEPHFPWNDVIDMSNDPGVRAIVMSLQAVFDVVQALRNDLATMTTEVGGGSNAIRTR